MPSYCQTALLVKTVHTFINRQKPRRSIVKRQCISRVVMIVLVRKFVNRQKICRSMVEQQHIHHDTIVYYISNRCVLQLQ